MVRAIYGIRPLRYVDREARRNVTLQKLAEAALDTADANDADHTGENDARIKAAREAYRLRFKQGDKMALHAMAEALGIEDTVQM